MTRLAAVLRQVAYDAGCALLGYADRDSLRYCTAQYNRVRAQLGSLDPAFTMYFGRLPEDAPAGEVRILARALALFTEERIRQWRAQNGTGLMGFLIGWPFLLNLDIT